MLVGSTLFLACGVVCGVPVGYWGLKMVVRCLPVMWEYCGGTGGRERGFRDVHKVNPHQDAVNVLKC